MSAYRSGSPSVCRSVPISDCSSARFPQGGSPPLPCCCYPTCRTGDPRSFSPQDQAVCRLSSDRTARNRSLLPRCRIHPPPCSLKGWGIRRIQPSNFPLRLDQSPYRSYQRRHHTHTPASNRYLRNPREPPGGNISSSSCCRSHRVAHLSVHVPRSLSQTRMHSLSGARDRQPHRNQERCCSWPPSHRCRWKWRLHCQPPVTRWRRHNRRTWPLPGECDRQVHSPSSRTASVTRQLDKHGDSRRRTEAASASASRLSSGSSSGLKYPLLWG